MSSLLTKSTLVLLSLALSISSCLAEDSQDDDDDGPAAKLDQQVKSDADALSQDQKELSEYQQQAKWYEEFAQKRLEHAAIEKAHVEKRLKELDELQKQNPKNDKSARSQEITALKAWLTEEAAKRQQIETTRARWKAAVESALSKTQQAKYKMDVDKASAEHQKELDKENAARKAENPKPAPPQIQQNTILVPGMETETGTIPVLGSPNW